MMRLKIEKRNDIVQIDSFKCKNVLLDQWSISVDFKLEPIYTYHMSKGELYDCDQFYCLKERTILIMAGYCKLIQILYVGQNFEIIPRNAKNLSRVESVGECYKIKCGSNLPIMGIPIEENKDLYCHIRKIASSFKCKINDIMQFRIINET